MCIFFSTIKNNLSFNLFIALLFLLFVSCEQEIVVEEVEEPTQFAIADLIQQKSYWEGSTAEFENSFKIDEEGNIKSKVNDSSFSGYIKIRARNGTITSMKSYTSNLADGDFF